MGSYEHMIIQVRGIIIYLSHILQPHYTWDEAAESCHGMSMDLVSITSKNEEDFVLRMIDEHEKTSTSVWIGFKRNGKKR